MITGLFEDKYRELDALAHAAKEEFGLDLEYTIQLEGDEGSWKVEKLRACMNIVHDKFNLNGQWGDIAEFLDDKNPDLDIRVFTDGIRVYDYLSVG